jgi:hypothetical protein
MRGVPEPGQWFRFREVEDTVFQAVYKYVPPSLGSDSERLVAIRYSPDDVKHVDIPVIRYNQFEIILDPEEVAMLCLAHLGALP